MLRENRAVELYFVQQSKFQSERRKASSRKVTLEEPRAMSIKANSIISDARLERLRNYLEKEVKQILPHEY